MKFRKGKSSFYLAIDTLSVGLLFFPESLNSSNWQIFCHWPWIASMALFLIFWRSPLDLGLLTVIRVFFNAIIEGPLHFLIDCVSQF